MYIIKYGNYYVTKFVKKNCEICDGIPSEAMKFDTRTEAELFIQEASHLNYGIKNSTIIKLQGE